MISTLPFVLVIYLILVVKGDMSGAGNMRMASESSQNGGAMQGPSNGKAMSTANSPQMSKAAMLQQTSQIGAALNQLSGGQVGKADESVMGTGPNGESLLCTPKKGVDGEFNAVNNELKKKCIEKAVNKEQIATKIAQKAKQETAKECKVKVDKESMFCHTRKVVKNVIEAPIYELNFYGNVAELKKHGETLLLAVIENLNYTIKKNPVKSNDRLQKPNVSIVFNELGGLLSQSGDLPAPKKDDPCAACLEAVNKEASTLEGNTDDCNASCDSVLLNSLVKPAHFRDVSGSGGGEAAGDKPAAKPEGEGGQAPSDDTAAAA
ncbi:hypothetical protein BDAP_001777 [Binucleata daphniae]